MEPTPRKDTGRRDRNNEVGRVASGETVMMGMMEMLVWGWFLESDRASDNCGQKGME